MLTFLLGFSWAVTCKLGALLCGWLTEAACIRFTDGANSTQAVVFVGTHVLLDCECQCLSE